MSELGFEIGVEQRSFDKEGITGTITKFVTEDKEYPLICINMLESVPSQLKLTLLQTLFSVNKGITPEEARNSVAVYALVKSQDSTGKQLYNGDGTEKTDSIRMGKIKASQVRSLVRIFKEAENGVVYELFGFLNKSKVLKGDMLFILSD